MADEKPNGAVGYVRNIAVVVITTAEKRGPCMGTPYEAELTLGKWNDVARKLEPHRKVTVSPDHVTHVFEQDQGAALWLVSGQKLSVTEPSWVVNEKLTVARIAWQTMLRELASHDGEWSGRKLRRLGRVVRSLRPRRVGTPRRVLVG